MSKYNEEGTREVSPMRGIDPSMNAVKGESPVGEAIIELEKSIEYLFDSVERHTNKLQPCLTPEMPSPVDGKEGNPEQPSSQLSQSIKGKSRMLHDLATRINRLTSRVEL